jgi:hypothetical protein
MRVAMNRFASADAERVARQVAVRARRLVPVRTGATRNSIRVVKGSSWRGPTWQVVVNSPVGEYLENGTRPHQIRPRNAKVLRFQIGGRTVFARIVNHPGTKATHFLSNAVRQVGIANGYNVRIDG